MAVVSGLAYASPAAAAPVTYQWVWNVGDGHCLEPQNGSLADAAFIVQATCDYAGPDFWGFISLGGSNYEILNEDSGYCLAAPAATDGTIVRQSDCDAGGQVTWTADLSSTGAIHLYSRINNAADHCLTVPGPTSAVGALIAIYPCVTHNNAQSWVVGVG